MSFFCEYLLLLNYYYYYLQIPHQNFFLKTLKPAFVVISLLFYYFLPNVLMSTVKGPKSRRLQIPGLEWKHKAGCSSCSQTLSVWIFLIFVFLSSSSNRLIQEHLARIICSLQPPVRSILVPAPLVALSR